MEELQNVYPNVSPNTVMVAKSRWLRRVGNKAHTMEMTKRQQGVSK
jgi:hypothetical protein